MDPGSRDALVLRDVRRSDDARVRRAHRRRGILLLARRSTRRESVGGRAERWRGRSAWRTLARRVRRRLPRRTRRRIVVLRDSRVLPNDVPESASAAAAALREQRLVLGLRKKQRRHSCRRRTAYRRFVADGRESAVRRHRRRLATRAWQGQSRRRNVGPRQREVSRHVRARGERSSRWRAPRNLDSPTPGAERRARFVAAAARPHVPRSNRRRGSPEGSRRHRAV